MLRPRRENRMSMSATMHTAEPCAQAIEALLARDDIRRLVAAYCRGVDRGDVKLLAGIFWDDSMVISGIVDAPGPAFASQIVKYVTANLQYCFHSIANEWIEIKGDHAVGEHYVLAQTRAQSRNVMTGGRYLDRYARRNGEWRILSRTFVADWNTDHPVSVQLDGTGGPQHTRSSFGMGDPVYALWSSL